MVLSDKTILSYLQDGGLEIDPFDSNRLNPNTVDLTINENGLIYSLYSMLDCKNPNITKKIYVI